MISGRVEKFTKYPLKKKIENKRVKIYPPEDEIRSRRVFFKEKVPSEFRI